MKNIKVVNDKDAPIAIFDSGLGGVSVLREMVKLMPAEDMYYFGDSANAPYGTKSIDEVRRMTISHVEEFMAKGCKGVVIACNTATSAAVRRLREMYPELPIVGIEPAVKPAVEAYPHGNILVMATPMTIHQEKLKHLIETYGGEANVIPLACPGLMDFVEVGNVDSPELKGFMRDLLYQYVGKLDAVVLGCTHYPFVAKVVREVLGDEVEIFDGGYGTAKEIKRRLGEQGLLIENTTKKGEIIFENSIKSQQKIDLFWKLLKM
ncbi:MAG: glutamate racemase [Lachnospiraceae bacterium]|nr:glutamate racemase [Lachnospiraceae bacterium]